jgi:uncharacterized membrane protein YuzA (DUF378 family)
MVAKILMIVGAVNWGLVGLSMLLGSMQSWNVVSMLLGSMPTLEAIVYLVVGIAGVMSIFGCRCKTCMAACATCEASAPGMEQKM